MNFFQNSLVRLLDINYGACTAASNRRGGAAFSYLGWLSLFLDTELQSSRNFLTCFLYALCSTSALDKGELFSNSFYISKFLTLFERMEHELNLKCSNSNSFVGYFTSLKVAELSLILQALQALNGHKVMELGLLRHFLILAVSVLCSTTKREKIFPPRSSLCATYNMMHCLHVDFLNALCVSFPSQRVILLSQNLCLYRSLSLVKYAWIVLEWKAFHLWSYSSIILLWKAFMCDFCTLSFKEDITPSLFFSIYIIV